MDLARRCSAPSRLSFSAVIWLRLDLWGRNDTFDAASRGLDRLRLVLG